MQRTVTLLDKVEALTPEASAKIWKDQPIFSTDDFIYDKVSKEMSAEASALGDMFGNAFQVKSSHTGKVNTFVHSIDKRDADGDVLWFEFIPAVPAAVPNVKRIIIFND